MLYDVRLALHYDYEGEVHGDRHLVRVAPPSIAGLQRVIAASLSFEPRPAAQTSFIDFFGNLVTTLRYIGYHDRLDVRLNARIAVESETPSSDVSPDLTHLQRELAALWDL